MTRISDKPILIENNIQISVNSGLVRITGTKGDISIGIPKDLKVEFADNKIILKGDGNKNLDNAIGLYRTLIQNAVTGLTREWQKSLEMMGVGLRAQSSGNELVLSVGFSHPVKIIAPKGISFSVADNKITVSGADKYLVGEEAAKIRRIKPAEPYKGKGIRYLGEFIRKKAGKAAKTVGGVGAK